MIARAAVVALAIVLPVTQSLAAQLLPPPPRPATAAEVAFGNMIVGGLTASTRALFSRKDPVRAFAVGAFGGAVHFAGKYLALEHGSAYGPLGLVVAGTGTSIVGNAGRGVGPLEEISIPFASARLRLSPGAPRKVRASIDLAQTAVVVSAFTTREMRVDWGRTLSSGAPVFMLRRGSLRMDDSFIGGVAVGPVALVDANVFNVPAIVRHELVHVHQHWFIAEAWGRPLETFVRARVPVLRRIPGWIELGVTQFGVNALSDELFGASGLEGIVEAEAYRLMRR